MKILRVLLPTLLLVVMVAFPMTASAALFGPIITPACHCPDSAPDFGCILQTINNVILLSIPIAIAIATAIIAYAGGLWILSPLNPKNREQGRTLLLNAVIGLIVVMLAVTFVDTLMKAIYNSSATGAGVESGLGPWNAILDDKGDEGSRCIKKTVVSPPPSQPTSGGSVTTQPGGSTTDPTPAGEEPNTQPTPSSSTAVAARICSAASAYRGQSTNACNCGGSACAWAVNQVLRNANLSPMGSTQVASIESGLRGGRGQSVTQSSAVCGDLVLITGARTSRGNSANHVGICLNSGCTSVISNSSSNRSFSWTSGPTFTPSYMNASPRFYRVTN